jgi:hypothetical protein
MKFIENKVSRKYEVLGFISVTFVVGLGIHLIIPDSLRSYILFISTSIIIREFLFGTRPYLELSDGKITFQTRYRKKFSIPVEDLKEISSKKMVLRKNDKKIKLPYMGYSEEEIELLKQEIKKNES